MSTTITMNVLLPQELERWIAAQVASGRYQSPSDVVSQAVRLLEDDDRLRESRIREIRNEIQIGLEQARRGELLNGEETLGTIRESLRSRARQGS